MNFFQPLVVDDYVFSNDIRKFGSFENFVSWYYRNWTGRVQNMAVIFFAFRNETAVPIFNIANSLVFMGFVWLAAWMVLGRRPRFGQEDGLFILSILFLVWFTLPTLGDCVFWKTGSICYLWPMFFLMLFILPYRLRLDTKYRLNEPAGVVLFSAGKKTGHTHAWVSAVLFFFLGLWVGFSNEQIFTSAAVLVLIWFIYILWKRMTGSVPVYQYLGIAGLAAGGIIQVASPGNYRRLSVRGPNIEISPGKFMRYFFEVYARIGIRLSIALGVMLLIFFIVFHLGKSKRYGRQQNSKQGDVEQQDAKQQSGRQQNGKRTNGARQDCNWQNEQDGYDANRIFQKGFCLVFILASLGSIAPFFLLSDFAAIRTSFFPACYMVLAAGTVVKHLLEKVSGSGYHKSRLAATLFVAVLLLADGVYGIRNAYLISDEYALRERIIEEYKTNNGLGGLEVPPVKTEPYHTVYIYDIGNDPAHWINRNVATFYGIEKIWLNREESSTCSLQHPLVGKASLAELLRRFQPFDLGFNTRGSRKF